MTTTTFVHEGETFTARWCYHVPPAEAHYATWWPGIAVQGDEDDWHCVTLDPRDVAVTPEPGHVLIPADLDYIVWAMQDAGFIGRAVRPFLFGALDMLGAEYPLLGYRA